MYILRMERSKEFDLRTEGKFNVLLQRMRREDRSVFYRRAKRYYQIHRTADDKVKELFREFCDSHPEVLSGEKHGLSKRWSAEEEAHFVDLINVGARLERKKQKVLEAFIMSMREWRKRARRGESAESSEEAGVSSLSSEERTCDVADRARGAEGSCAQVIIIIKKSL